MKSQNTHIVAADATPLHSLNPKSEIQYPKFPEPLLTKEMLRDHYKISLRTINYAMTLGLPRVSLGRHVRFRLSEVQSWFERNGCRRFAAEGIKMALTKALPNSQS